MTEEKARSLIKLYTEGWKRRDIKKILKTLTDNCKVIESHGPVYCSTKEVKEWVEGWFKEGYRVKEWKILSFLFSKNKAVFEWVFEFISPKQGKRLIEGISIVKFKKGRISYLREYRTTHSLYRWKKGK